jgi:hypothetical protein
LLLLLLCGAAGPLAGFVVSPLPHPTSTKPPTSVATARMNVLFIRRFTFRE